jgi:hypothetical protein
MSNPALTSASFANNSAAKDDWIDITGGQTTFSVNRLLANDPGSATFKGFLNADLTPDTDVTVNGSGNSAQFTLPHNVSAPIDLTYYEQIGNGGTLAKATAHFAYAFTDSTTFNLGQPSDSWAPVAANNGVQGWVNKTGQVLEVAGGGYVGVGGGTTPWLDTQGSPGGIDIIHKLRSDVAASSPGTLSISISAEQFTAGGNAYQTDPNEHVLVLFDGKQVMDITQASLGDYDHFHTLSANVVAQGGGHDTIEIESVGVSTNVGMALSAVTFTGWHV